MMRVKPPAMQLHSLPSRPVDAARLAADAGRFTREPTSGWTRRQELVGDARPGDVLSLAGGAMVRDVNGNGLVDGYDALVRPSRLGGPSLRIDVRG
jgi:hypothetical protein